MSVKFWWERAYQQDGRQGRIARTKEDSETIACPKCGNAPVVYNGNYFCDSWAYPAGPGDCDWALAHPARTVRDRAICDLIGLDYQGGLKS